MRKGSAESLSSSCRRCRATRRSHGQREGIDYQGRPHQVGGLCRFRAQVAARENTHSLLRARGGEGEGCRFGPFGRQRWAVCPTAFFRSTFRTEHTAAWAQALNRFVAILIFNYFLGVEGAASVGQSLAPAPPKVHRNRNGRGSGLRTHGLGFRKFQ